MLRNMPGKTFVFAILSLSAMRQTTHMQIVFEAARHLDQGEYPKVHPHKTGTGLGSLLRMLIQFFDMRRFCPRARMGGVNL